MITIQKGQEKTFQKYAREEMKLKLLNDILIDMEICKIEGWDRLEYLVDLKNLIDSFFVTNYLSNK